MEETKMGSGFMDGLMQQALAAADVPTCGICHKRIIGPHADYIDKERHHQKICMGCIYKALDYYIAFISDEVKQ